MNRRYFLMSTAVMAGSAAIKGLAQSPNETVRVAVIGLGGRGSSHVNAWSRMKNVEVAAICDVDESHIGEKFKLLEGRGVQEADHSRRHPEAARVARTSTRCRSPRRTTGTR